MGCLPSLKGSGFPSTKPSHGTLCVLTPRHSSGSFLLTSEALPQNFTRWHTSRGIPPVSQGSISKRVSASFVSVPDSGNDSKQMKGRVSVLQACFWVFPFPCNVSPKGSYSRGFPHLPFSSLGGQVLAVLEPRWCVWVTFKLFSWQVKVK